MKTILLVLAGGLLLGTPAIAADASRRNPNIVFVLFDDLGYGQPKCYRADTEYRMPTMDRLAREGMRFTDAHAAASVCTPTRYGIITGRYPARIGQYGVLTTFSKPIIPKARLTVASMLRQHGYDTACIGKWHLGMDWEGRPGDETAIPVGTRLVTGPDAAGFDLFYGYTHARNIRTVIEQDRVVARVEEVETQPLLAKKAVAFLDDPARREKPFFLYLPLPSPHVPIVPAPQFVGASGTPGREGRYGDWLYEGDWVLGQVLEALDRNRLAGDTLVMVSSDNGAAGRSYAPLRGAKTSIYEGGHREPFLARWPGRIEAGSVCDDTICLNDLMATCAEIVGATLPDDAAEDSVSILPDLLGTATGPVREAIVHQDFKGGLAIRQGPWKLVFPSRGGSELYNLHTDLGETNDVADAHPEVVGRLTTLLKKYIDEGRSTAGAPQRNEVPISVGKPAGGDGKKRKTRKGQATGAADGECARDVALAADPAFD